MVEDSKMKLLFVYTNVDGCHEDNYAFGLATIVSVARKLGHECRVELITERMMFDGVIGRFDEFDPDLVGFTSVTSQFSVVKELAGRMKGRKESLHTVCGGVHPTLWPDSIVEAEAIDFFVIGEGEHAFAELLGKLERGQPYYSCPNLVYARKDMVMRTNLLPMEEELDQFPFPDREIYPLEATIKSLGFAPFHFARGCPFPCTYCANHAQAQVYGEEKSRIRAPSPEYSICEIEDALEKHPYIKKIAIYDDIFGLNRKWRNEFLTLYKDRIKLPYLVLLRADVITEEFARQLKETGCERIMFGVESGNDYVRNEIMKRKMSRETIVKAFMLAHSYDMETNAINIIGVPGETEEMLWDTIKLNREIRPTSSGVNIFYPYKGTKLGEQCFESGLVTDEMVRNFNNERRETVLGYDEVWKKKLSDYHKNWGRLVYPFWSINYIKSTVRDIPLFGNFARMFYRAIVRRQ